MENRSLTTGEEKIFLGNVSNDKQGHSLCTKFIRSVKSNLLLVSTICGVLLGFGLGFAVREGKPSENALMWLGLPGQLYLRLLKMMIVPLIVCSVICGAASLDPKSNGKISLIALIFAVSTNALGSALGVGSAFIFKPGADTVEEVKEKIEGNMQTQDILADLIRNIIPDNLFEATFAQTLTKYKESERVIETNVTGEVANMTEKHVSKYLGRVENANIIGLIFACTLLGVAAASLKEKSRAFLEFVQATSDTVITVVRWFMWTTPFGVLSLIAVSIASIEDVQNVFAQLGIFIATVTIGIVIQQLLLMPAIFFFFTRKNPYKFLLSIARPWMIAFAATSTAVAIPEMLTACEEKNKIDKRVSRFVVPFSVTISCNGSAVYIAAASVFIANLTGSRLTFGDALMIWIIVTVAAMAVPSVPSASIMTTIMVLTSMNIPIEDIALLLAVEWYLDRIRSTSSVVSHTFCTAVVYSLCKSSLQYLDEKHIRRNETELTVVVDDEDEMLMKKAEVNGHSGKIGNGSITAAAGFSFLSNDSVESNV